LQCKQLVNDPDHVASPELCDGKDNNCNGATDEGNPGANLACDTGNQGVCAAGVTKCVTGGIICDQTIKGEECQNPRSFR
jgi:hypothetical protein